MHPSGLPRVRQPGVCEVAEPDGFTQTSAGSATGGVFKVAEPDYGSIGPIWTVFYGFWMVLDGFWMVLDGFYLSVVLVAAVGCVLREEVEFEGGEGLSGEFVLPQQLQFADADDLLVAPKFHQKEIAQRQQAATSHGFDLAAGVTGGVIGHTYGLEKSVGPVVAARGANKFSPAPIAGGRSFVTGDVTGRRR